MLEGNVLEIHEINRSFGTHRALKDVSFTVQPQRLTGFVGRNGAGKTTAMRIILGVLRSDSGRVTLHGSALGPDDRRLFGYMPEERGLYPKMHVAEHLVYLARLHGIPTRQAKRSTDDLLERMELTERANDAVESLSLGNQQRAQIAAALVHNPEVLILDEPFSGLDPVAVEVVQSVLKDYASKGAPVLFSSHQLDIVERLCDDLVIISEGSIRASGPREELRREHAKKRYELSLSEDASWVQGVPGITVLGIDGGNASFEASTPEASQHVLKSALERDTVLGFSQPQPSLAEIFREVIQ